MKFIFLSLFLFLSACSNVPAPEQKLYLQSISEVDAPFKAKIEATIQKINLDAGHDVVSLTPNGGRPLVFLKRYATDIYSPTLAHTQYLDYRCLIEIDPGNVVTSHSDKDLQYVILHELGHCYGLLHNLNSNSVMYSTYLGTENMTVSQENNLTTIMRAFAKTLNLN